MSTFFENIAPGITSMGAGYLSAQRATEEKYREEEIARDKDALRMYKDLVTSGQFEPVDPVKGARDGGVLMIGDMFLQPVKISPLEKAKYEHEERGRAHVEKSWESKSKEEELNRAEAEKKRQHEARMREIGLKKEQVGLEREKAKPVGGDSVDLVDKQGHKIRVSRARLRDILTSDPTSLPPYDREVRDKIMSGEYTIGWAGSSAVKVGLSPKEQAEQDRKNRERLAELREIMAFAGQTVEGKKTPALTEEELTGYVEEMNTLLPDDSTYVYAAIPPKNIRFWPDKPGEAPRISLPTARTKDGGSRQLTIGDIRAQAAREGIAFAEALRRMFKFVGQGAE